MNRSTPEPARLILIGERMDLMHMTMGRELAVFPKNFVVCWLSLCFVLLLFQGRAVSAEPSQGGLRGVFLKHKPEGKADQAVGRIALRQVKGDNEQLIRLDNRFRSGDEFRIEVSSNRDGWLYLLHRQGNSDPQVLWPEQEKGDVSDENRVRAGQSYVIPPRDVIQFNKETGAEFFYLAITDKPGAPRLTTQGVKEVNKKTPTKLVRKEKKESPQWKQIVAKKQLVQIGVRGVKQPPGQGMSTVVFDPGKQDSDRYLYFAAPKEGEAGLTLIEFQLRHE